MCSYVPALIIGPAVLVKLHVVSTKILFKFSRPKRKMKRFSSEPLKITRNMNLNLLGDPMVKLLEWLFDFKRGNISCFTLEK